MTPPPMYVTFTPTQVSEVARLAQALGHPALARHLRRARPGVPVGMTTADAQVILALAETASRYAREEAKRDSAEFWSRIHTTTTAALEALP